MFDTQFITGINAVQEAILGNRSIEKVFIEKDTNNPRLFEILKICRKKKIPVSLVHAKKLEVMSKVNTQGVLAKASVKEYSTLDKLFANAEAANQSPLFLIPEGVEDPHNLGALMRSALCTGVHGIILPSEGAVGLTDGTARASAGAVEHIDIVRVSDMPGTLKLLKDKGVRLIGLEAGFGPVLWDARFDGPIALILGGENRGIRPHIMRELNERVQVPMSGQVGSLNVSATGAMALYEVMRQRAKKIL